MTMLAAAAATFLFCVLSALIPFLNAEIYLLAAAALAPPEWRVVLVFAAAAGQTAGNVGMYGVGRGAFGLPGIRLGAMLGKAKTWCRQRTPPKALIAFSAATGLPPFYIVSIACGLMRTPILSFVALGLSGRFVRFGAVALLPLIIQHARTVFGR
jgi:membrane protein YqaA with SNARE-associated domain